MPLPNRPIAFVLTASNHGSMIVNRNDHRIINKGAGYGVGFQILNKSAFDEAEVTLAIALLNCRRRHFGSSVLALDGGANIGVHTIEWARHMHGWGSVLAFEAQEAVYYALCGNIALNNCFNASARLAALGDHNGELSIPRPDYLKPASFGSLELKKRANTEFIGQDISYEAKDGVTVPLVSVDSLDLARLDFFKLDVEGMESEVFKGALQTLQRCRPIVLVEVIKSDRAQLDAQLQELGYKIFPLGMNHLAVHGTDPILSQLMLKDGNLMINF